MTSTMITSAPSRAHVTAWARPCPRAPPVMKATLPSSIAIATPVLEGGAFAARVENYPCPGGTHPFRPDCPGVGAARLMIM
jgi:hypothetical protein